MPIHRKLTTICAAAVLAVGLAACGGGGDDTPVTDTQEYKDLQAKVMQLETERDAANAAKMEAEEAKAAAEGERDAANAAKMTAEGERDAANAAKMAAEEAKMAAEEARDAAITARDAAITARDLALADDDADQNMIDSLNTTIAEKNTTIAEKNTEISGLEGDIDDLNDTIAEKNTEISGLEGDIDDLNDTIAANATKISDLEDDLKDARDEIARLKGTSDGSKTLALPAGNTLDTALGTASSATLVIAAGTSKTRGGVVFACPAGGADCTVVVQKSLGVVIASYTGGMVTAAAAAPSDGKNLSTAIANAMGANAPAEPSAVTAALGTDSGIKAAADGMHTLKGYSQVGSAVTTGLGTGWTMNTLQSPDTHGTTVTVGVFSNRDAGERQRFSTKYTSLTNNALPMRATVSGDQGAWSSAATDSTAVPSTPGDSVPKTENATFTGTFGGLGGTFTCTESTGCSIGRDAKGKLSASDNWTFTPTNPAGFVTDPDTDYSVFGWWQRTTGSVHHIGTFASASMAFDNDTDDTTLVNMNQVHGKAKYKGPAAGFYAVDGGASAGKFTAAATLEANFGVTGTDDDGKVKGMIDSFMLDGVAAAGWSVTLGETDVTTPANTSVTPNVAADTDATVNGSVSGGTGSKAWSSGSWEATFVGARVGGSNRTPAAVVGEFSATTGGTSATSVIGAFGGDLSE